MKRKAIILAGGSGSRLYPSTKSVSKQLLPVYDKPMVYYSISLLMLAGIREILLISTPQDISRYEDLLGNGTQWGIKLEFAVQPSPDGLAQAFLIGENFLDGSQCALILGDNIFYGHGISKIMSSANNNSNGATIFAYRVKDPERFGVVEFDDNKKVISIEEKPKVPRSNFAVTGLYFYDNQVCDVVKTLSPSERGELEITDLNKFYLQNGLLNVETLGRGYAWLDTGTCDSLMEASSFISTVQRRQGLLIGCPEEIAYRNKWITDKQLYDAAISLSGSQYGKYLKELI